MPGIYLHDADVAAMRASADEEEIRDFAEVIAPLESAGQLDTSNRGPCVVIGTEPAARAWSHSGTPLRSLGRRRRASALRRRPPALHVPVERPGFRSPGDEDPAEGSRTRTAWLDRAESEGLLLATAHVPPHPMGRVIRAEGQRIFRPCQQ